MSLLGGFIIFSLASVIISIGLCFIFWRSSPVWPKTLPHLRIELLFQYYGFVAFLEDKFIQKKRNVFNPKPQLPNRLAIVTGGNRGIGVEVVKKLLNSGLSVIVAVRRPDKSIQEISEIVNVNQFRDQLIIEELDITDGQSIRTFASKVTGRFRKIDILIHNAGIMAVPQKNTIDGLESQMSTNYLGPFLLTHLLLPNIRAAGAENLPSRIVFVSSVLHLAGQLNLTEFQCSSNTNYYPVAAYMNSKLCQVAIAKEWQRIFDCKGWNIQSFSVHPGIVNTEIIQYLAKKRMWWRRYMCKTPEEGSRSIVYAALSEDLNYSGGDYISNCQKAKAHELSDDVQLGRKLFKFTCDLLKVEADSC